MMLNLDKRVLLVLAVLMMLVIIPTSFAADSDDAGVVGVNDVSVVDAVSESAVDAVDVSTSDNLSSDLVASEENEIIASDDSADKKLSSSDLKAGEDYITTPGISTINNYTKGDSRVVVINVQIDEWLESEIPTYLDDVYVYIGDNKYVIDGVSPTAHAFNFNLNTVTDYLVTGSNTLYFGVNTESVENWGYTTLKNPLTVNVVEATPSYDYETSVSPATVDYVKGTSSVVTVTADFDSQYASDLDFGSMFAWINGEETNNRYLINGVTGGASSFTFDLSLISDKLNDGANTITFHPTTQIIEDTFYSTNYNFNTLTVNASSQEPAGYAWTIQGKTGGYDTLAEAVNAASNGDTIVGAPGTVELISSTLKISKDVDIIAANSGDVVLKGSTNSVLNISEGNTVNLVNIDFKDYSIPGSANIRGGAIYNNGTMTLDGCTFENITISGSSGYAPAIYNYGDMVINNCLFENLNGYYGAAIYSYYSGPYGNYKRSNITVANSTFRNINSQNGAAVLYLYQSNKNIIENCTFEDLKTTRAVIRINTVNATVKDSTFRNINASLAASDDYSVIFQSQQTSNVYDFIGNYIDNVTATGSTTSNGGVSFILSKGTLNSHGKANISNNIIINSKLTNNAADSTYSYVGASLINSAYGNVNYNFFANNEVNGLTGKAYEVLAFGSVDANYNYWGSNEGPNSTSHSSNITVTYWTVIDAEIPDPIVIGASEDIVIKLKANDTSGTLTNLPEDWGTITLPVTSTLNEVQDSVLISDSGTIAYDAVSSGDETLTVFNNPFTFEVNADASAIIYVDDATGTAAGPGTSESPYKTIAQALNVATAGKTIIIRSGTYNEKDLLVDEDITIKADKNAEVVIDANKEGRIFIVDDATLTLRDLTLKNGEPDYDADDFTYDGKGGAILVDSGSLIASNIKVYNSSAAAGGAIASIAGATGTLSISGSEFKDNSINENLYYEVNDILGGAIYSDCNNLYVDGCTFENNKALNDEWNGANGAAIYTVGSANITSSTFTNNKAARNGGAIYIEAGNMATVLIKGNTFTGNNATLNGGAIASSSSASTIISDNTFNTNKATNGGALYVEGLQNVATVSSNEFNGNSADNGGSIYSRNAELTLTSNTIGESTASNSGKKIYITGGSVNSVVSFLGNSTLNAEAGSTIDLIANITDDMGNEIKGGSITFTADGTTLATIDISWLNDPKTTFTLPENASEDILISGSFSLDRDGTVKTGVVHPAVFNWYIEGGNGFETLADAIEAANAGDVIYGNAGTYTVNGLIVNKNITIKANETGSIILDGNGTRIFSIRNSSNLNLVNLTLINGGTGGGGFATVTTGNLFVINSTLKDLSSGTKGGAISVSTGCNLTVEGSTFENITSSGHAPAISGEGSNSIVIIKDSTFNNINCTSDYSVLEIQGNLTIERSNFTNINGKYANNWYGAVGGKSNLWISECQFINITGGDGSAVYYTGSGILNITKSVFINNTSIKGAVCTYSNPNAVYIHYNIFMDNEVQGNNGSGVYLKTGNINLDANYNFWGTNEQPSNAVINYPSNATKWTIVSLTAESDSLTPGATVPITVDFTKCTDGTANYTLEDTMPDFTFELAANLGTVDSPVVVSNGQATANYVAPSDISESTEVTITATPGNAILVFNVEKSIAPTSLAADNIIMEVGSGNLTATLTADGTGVEGKTISLEINGETLSGITDANGVAVIDLSGIAVGAYSDIEVNFTGDENYSASTAIVNITVNEIPVPSWFIGETGYVTLAEAVEAAVEGDVIIGLPGTYEINNIAIAKNITIKANESDEIILHVNSTRFATVTDGNTLNLENLIMENGINALGGILNVNKATVNIDNCTFRDSKISGTSSAICAIYGVDSNITIKDSKFDNINTSSSSYNAYIGAIYALRTNIEISNTAFTNINAPSMMNGAPLFVSGSNLVMKDSEFSDCQGATGAIYLYGGNATIDNTKFIANNGTAGAGAITGAGVSTTAANITVTNSIFKDLLSNSNGGAISSSGKMLVVEQSVFMNNKLNKTTNNGGAIYLSGDAVINYNIFINNSDNRPVPQGNDIYQSSTTKTANADYNYFGSNDKPDNTSVNNKTTLDKWVILDLSIDKDPSACEIATITADLTIFTDGETNGTVEKLLPELKFDASAVNGSVDPAAITISPENEGKATISYTAPDTIGEDIVVLKLYDEDVAELSINVVAQKIATTVNAENVEVTVGSGSLTVTLTADGTGVEGKTISIVISDETLSGVTDANGVATIDLSSLDIGTYSDIEVNFAGDGVYLASSDLVNITVKKLESNLDVELDEDVIIATLTSDDVGVEGKTIKATLNDGTVLEAVTDEDGIAIIDLSDLAPGEYTIVVSFEDDDTYEDASADEAISYTVDLYLTELVVDDVTVTVGEGTLTATLTSNGVGVAGKTLVLEIENKLPLNGFGAIATMTAVTDEDGVAVFDLSGLEAGIYEATVSYTDGVVYESIDADVTIEVDKKAADTTVEIDDDNNLIVTVKDGEDSLEGIEVELTINNQTLKGTTDADGKAVIALGEMEDGSYPATISFTNDTYADPNLKTFVLIKTKEVEVPVEVPVVANGTMDVETTDDAVEATLTDSEGNPIANATITALVDGEEQNFTTDENGKVSIPVGDNATVELSYTDPENGATVKYATKVVTKEVEVEVPVEVPVVANGTMDVETTDDAVEATLTDSEGNPIANATITAVVDGEEQNFTTDENGKVSIPVGDNATVELSYTDPENGATVKYATKVVTKEVEVPEPKANATVELTTEDGSAVTVTVKDLDGKPIANATAVATVNGEETNITTDSEGKATIPLTGNSTVKVSFTDPANNATTSNEMSVTVINTEKIIEVIPNRTETVIEYSNMTTKSVVVGVDGRIGEYFYATLKDINGKVLANKTVGIGFNGKVYNKTTDENGTVKLQINLKAAGRYTFAIAYLGDEYYNGTFEVALITVEAQKAKLTTANKAYKASAKTKSISATFKSASGNAIPGIKVTFTVNGKTYTAKTNSKGVATVNVSLNKKGTYSFTAKTTATNAYASVSAKAKLTIS